MPWKSSTRAKLWTQIPVATQQEESKKLPALIYHQGVQFDSRL